MDTWVWIGIVFLAACFGYGIACVMSMAGRSDLEDQWREKLMCERDSHKGTQKQLMELRQKAVEKGVVI